MKEWLNQHKDRMSTKELWDIDSNQPLTFPDLKKWLDNRDQMVEIKKQDVKGKRKAPASPTKLKKNDRDRPVVQRKHKKYRPASESDESE